MFFCNFVGIYCVVIGNSRLLIISLGRVLPSAITKAIIDVIYVFFFLHIQFSITHTLPLVTVSMNRILTMEIVFFLELALFLP